MPSPFQRLNRALRALVIVTVLAAGAGGSALAQRQQVLRVTIVPGESPTEITRKFAPLGRYLEKELRMKIEWTPIADYDAVVDAMVDRKIDLAVLGGFTLVQANVRSGGRIIPLVQRESDASFRSVFITRTGSGISRLEDLKGRTFSFGPRSSTSGHLMPRAFLLAAKVRPDIDLQAVSFSAAHDATVAAVASGTVDAGALNIYVWERLVAGGKVDTSAVRVFFTTPPYDDASWSVHADIPVAVREAIKAAFLKLSPSTPEGREVLEQQSATRYVPSRIENYQRIKAAAENAGLLK
ncbi:putative selenate ABC transporter substrate-binding protein [Roseateles sp.]|uniref:putative selenate ABC transporter substrate-binding protein n=1 Tax=Roseateles sp. TaxID=1971397 RepID=UPI002F42B4C1